MSERQSASFARILLIVGLVVATGLTAWGLAPTVLQLVKSNQLIDDRGIQPGESEIIQEWVTWSTQPRFIVPLSIGVSLYFLLGMISLMRRHKGTDQL